MKWDYTGASARTIDAGNKIFPQGSNSMYMTRIIKVIGIILAAVVLLVSPLSHAEQENIEGQLYQIDNIPGCEFWFPLSGKEDSAVWTGRCVGGLIHGHGVLIFDTGSYEGKFSNGKLQGFGIILIKDSIKYEGEFKDTMLHGQGVLVVNDMYRYEGEFKNNGKDGYGIQKFPDGSRYEGQYLDDWRHGHGVWTLNDEKKCEGEWRKGELIGIAKGWVDGQARACITEDYAVKFLD